MNLRIKTGYGLGHVLNDLVAAMWFSYLLVFLHKVLGLDTYLCGIVILIGQIADGIATPLVGLESDYWASRPLANPVKARKLWHLGGSICVAAAFPFLFMKCIVCSEDVSPLSFLVYYIPFVVIFQFGWAATQVSHLSLIPELSDTSSENIQLNSIRYAATVCSNLIAYGVTWLVLQLGNAAPNRPASRPTINSDPLPITSARHTANIYGYIVSFVQRKSSDDDDNDRTNVTPADATKFITITGVLEVIGVTFTILFHVLTKHSAYSHHNFRSDSLTQSTTGSVNTDSSRTTRETHAASAVVHGNGGFSPENDDGVPDFRAIQPVVAKRAARLARLTWYLWLQRIDFYIIGLIYMCTRLYINITSVYLPLYVLDSLGLDQTAIAYAPLAVYTASLASSILIKPLLDRVGNRVSFTVGCALAIGSCAFIYFLSGTWLAQPTGSISFPLVLLSLLVGTASAALFVTALALISELIGEQKSSSAFVFGAMSLTDKISNGVVIAIIQAYHPCTKNALACSDFYIYIMTFVPGISIAVALLADLALLFFMRRARRDIISSLLSPTERPHSRLRDLADEGASTVHGHAALPVESRRNSVLLAEEEDAIERIRNGIMA